MSKRLVSLSSLFVLGALPLVLEGCAYDASAPIDPQDPVAATEDPLMKGDVVLADPEIEALPPPPPDELTVTTVATASGWRKIRVKGTTKDLDTGAPVAVDKELVVIEKDDAIGDAPVAAVAKTSLESDAVYRKSIGETDSEVMVVDPQLADQAEAAAAAESDGPVAYAWCGSYDKTLEKSLSTTKSYTYKKTSEPGAFSGSIDFEAKLVANATGKGVVRVKRAACVPYGLSFKHAQFTGKADVTAKAKVNGKFEKSWKYSKKLAEPYLGSVAFSVAGVPILLRFTAPIEIGVDATAKATLTFDGSATARGSFDVKCTSGGCSGTKSATYGFTNGVTPSMAAEAKVDVTPWVQGALRVAIYDDWIGYGQVGVKAKVDADLWGYAGNGCGDADGDGVNELVTGAVIDARVGVDVTAKAAFFGSDVGSWSWPVVDKHVGFWDLGPSTNNATSPIFQAKATGTNTVEAKGRMRPCWPYADAMHYRLSWGDGTAPTEFFSSPATTFTKTHTYASTGLKTLSLLPLEDTKDRGPGRATIDSVQLGRVIFVPPGGLVMKASF